MAERDHALLAMKLAVVFPLEDRVVEHAGRAHEIDAVIGEIPATQLVVPLEHYGLKPPIPGPRIPGWGVIGAELDLASGRGCRNPYK